MTEITTAEEIHAILLDIARELQRVCREGNVPCYMLGGTMLGAVRHGGFIPWDDDMDFGVPREHFDRLRALLEQRLPAHYRVVTLQTSSVMLSDILKIEDTRTEMDELFKENAKERIGVNIDIFPLDGVDECHLGSYRKALQLKGVHYYRFLSTKQRHGSRKLAAILAKLLLAPLLRTTIPAMIRRTLERHIGGEYLTNVYGAWGMREAVPRSVFGSGKLYAFADTEFYGPEDAHAYLSRLYGDYMQLPPEDKRHLHITGCRRK
nr:LicD family protein [Bacteroides sp.]